MAYKRKTRDVWHIQTNCGYGWETEATYDTYSEAKADLPEYRKYINAYNGIATIKKGRERL